MTTLILPPRYTEDSIRLWRAAQQRGWHVHRMQGWRVQDIRSDDYILYGEPLFVSTIAQQLEVVLFEPAFDWLTTLPYELLGRKIEAKSFSEINSVVLPSFIKPADDKCFTAKVYHGLGEIEHFDLLPKNTPILNSEPVHWLREYRAFICDGVLKTHSLYCVEGELCEQEESELFFDQALSFVNRVLETGQVTLPPAVVLDVGMIEGFGWAIVEANPCWGSGLYQCDEQEVLSTLARACTPKSELTENQRVWCIERKVDL